MVATFLWQHGGGNSSHLMAKQRQNLVYLVHAQGLLALFQFAHEASPTPDFSAKSIWVRLSCLRRTLTNSDNDVSIYYNDNCDDVIELRAIIPFRVQI